VKIEEISTLTPGCNGLADHAGTADHDEGRVVARLGGSAMRIRGIVRGATLVEEPPGSDEIEMRLELQGVGPGQPRWIVVPYPTLLRFPELDPESVIGHGFQAEIEHEGGKRWVVQSLEIAGATVLRPE
jgi:hypothetical protein